MAGRAAAENVGPPAKEAQGIEHFDVLIVGAGLSGIGAAYYLQTRCPTKTFAILEGRNTMGGTWDLFRYPGVRSDSDMYTLRYQFQQWPVDLAYGGKRIVVIGSGATAVTLVPALAESAAHVIMLQRSPTYIVARPSEDFIANWLRRRVSARLAYGLVRWKNVLLQMYFYSLGRPKPGKTKKGILHLAKKALGPEYDVEKHFSTSYSRPSAFFA